MNHLIFSQNHFCKSIFECIHHFSSKLLENEIIYTWIFFSSCDIWVTTWCKLRGWNNISGGNENKLLLSCYVETQFINQFILFIWTLSPAPPTAATLNASIYLRQKAPAQNYIKTLFRMLNLLTLTCTPTKNPWHSGNGARLRSDELYQIQKLI